MGLILFCIIVVWIGVGSIWLTLAKNKEGNKGE